MALRYEGYFSTDKPKKFTNLIKDSLEGMQTSRLGSVKEKIEGANTEDKLKKTFLRKIEEAQKSFLFKKDKNKSLLKASVVFYFFYNTRGVEEPKLIKTKIVFAKTKKEDTWLGVIFLYGIKSKEELDELIGADASEDLKHFKTGKNSVIGFFQHIFPDVFEKVEKIDDKKLKK